MNPMSRLDRMKWCGVCICARQSIGPKIIYESKIERLKQIQQFLFLAKWKKTIELFAEKMMIEQKRK